MSALDRYTIDARPTRYADVLFRSRLEARWAAFFDLAGWRWQYEPSEHERYNPDFLLEGYIPLAVEVKPLLYITEPQLKVIGLRLERYARHVGSRCEALILGLGPRDLQPDRYCADGTALGWLGESVPVPNDDDGDTSVWSETFSWGRGILQAWHTHPCVGICSEEGWYADRISGRYDGNSQGDAPWLPSRSDWMWRMAGDATRFDIITPALKAPCEHCRSTVQAQCKHGASSSMEKTI